MATKAVGLHGLIDALGLKIPAPVVRSEVNTGKRRTIVTAERVLEQYPMRYETDGTAANLRFAMRYEPIDLGALSAIFEKVDKGELEAWIRSEPTGIFARRAWYLYELSTGETLDVPDLIPSGYVDLLDDELHITGPTTQVRRQRINDNLLGTQNYVAQTLRDFTEDVHFVCPKPEDVAGLMTAWMNMEGRLEGSEQTDAIAAAAAAAFGFVFIHPFEDGNGRIHRFLVHHMLAKLGFTPKGLLFPVSAAMLRNRAAYDRVLEQYSGSILPFINFQVDSDGRMTVGNATAHLYRFFDATAQGEYLYRCIQETIRKDLREEIGLLAAFDGAVRRVMHIVDMPDRRASLLVRLILQNKGKLSNSKRTLFAEVSDDELHNIERAVWQTWEEEHAKAGAKGEGEGPAARLDAEARSYSSPVEPADFSDL